MKAKNSVWTMLLTVIATSILVGTGIHWWENLPQTEISLERGEEIISGNLAVTYKSDWTRAGGYMEFLEIQEFDTLKLIIFTNVEKNQSAWQSFEEFKNSFQGGMSRIDEEINPAFAFEVIEYETQVENSIYNLYSQKSGTLAVWQSSGFNYALIDEGSLHQEDGTFNEFLAKLVPVQS